MTRDTKDRNWVEICPLTEITPGTAVAALVNGLQLAIVRTLDGDQLYAVGNFDPFSKAYVMARGIVGDRDGVPKIASPMYKQAFDLRNGRNFDDPSISIGAYPVRVVNGLVEVRTDEGEPS